MNRAGGQTQSYCWGTTVRWDAAVPGARIGCGFPGGSSGGPWLRDSASNRLGYAVSETTGVSGSDNHGPYFDNAVRDMFTQARDRAGA